LNYDFYVMTPTDARQSVALSVAFMKRSAGGIVKEAAAKSVEVFAEANITGVRMSRDGVL
jgi:hypothetical protein